VRAVSQIAQPGFQRLSIVFADNLAVGNDLGFTRDGSPFAGRVQERDVDLGVGFQIVGLAGLGVGVEEEIKATAFLYN